MKAKVFDLQGNVVEEIELPKVFEEEFRPDLIRRAFLAEMSEHFQPKGVFEKAGMQTSADYIGRRRSYRSMITRGIARLPRILLPKGGIGQVRVVPQARKGRRAHPPKVEKNLVEKINKKEKKKAVKSAIASLKERDLISKRHAYDGDVPIIVVDDFEKIEKTKDVREVLKKLGLEEEMKRAQKKKVRSGKGKMRGRRYKRKKSVLIIIGNEKAPLKRGARNLPGVDVVSTKELSITHLAPGGQPGRLAIITKNALQKMV